jgi:NAD(P)-dependent dehydrogenase (short-subunit alcohol dehydrogenase family)
MAAHPAIAPNRVAVITGAASGIGLATAKQLARLGMRVCLADRDADVLNHAAAEVAEVAGDEAKILGVPTDVSRRDEVERLKDAAMTAFGEVDFLMNNAGVEGRGQIFGDPERWKATLDTNLWGVIHGVQVFGPGMADRGTPGAIVNTGSKQGITTPPGDTAYNVSKAGVKVVTEALAHELRNRSNCQVTAHLLIPGFVYTGFTKAKGVTEKPEGAWSPDQVATALLTGIARGDFYILCPDNETTPEMDRKRILWAAEDLVRNRPALSRWHPDFKEAFASYMAEPES